MLSKKLPLFVAAASIFFAAPAAFAFPQDAPHPPHKMEFRKPAPQVNTEKQAEIIKLREDYRTAIAPLREKLMQKNMELRSLAPNPNVKPEDLKALVAEIIELRKQVQKVNAEFKAKMPKRPGMAVKPHFAQQRAPMPMMKQGCQRDCSRSNMSECPRAGHADKKEFRNGHAMQGQCPRR